MFTVVFHQSFQVRERSFDSVKEAVKWIAQERCAGTSAVHEIVFKKDDVVWRTVMNVADTSMAAQAFEWAHLIKDRSPKAMRDWQVWCGKFRSMKGTEQIKS